MAHLKRRFIISTVNETYPKASSPTNSGIMWLVKDFLENTRCAYFSTDAAVLHHPPLRLRLSAVSLMFLLTFMRPCVDYVLSVLVC